MSPVLLVFVAVALALIGGAAWLLTQARGQERGEEVLQRLNSSNAVADIAEPVPLVETSLPGFASLGRLLGRAGLQVPTSRLMLFVVGVVILAGLVFVIGGLLPAFILVGGGLTVLYLFLQRLAARRRNRIVAQLPNLLEAVIRVLAAGNSLEECFASAARESTDPIKSVFVSVSRQVKLGAPIDEVLAEVGTFYRIRDLRVLALAASVNRRYGGSLRNVLKSLITITRQRDAAARELRALTGETRFSAAILTIVPIGLAAFIFFRNRNYYIEMFHNPTGKILIFFSLGLQLLGMLVLWRMLNSTEDAET